MANLTDNAIIQIFLPIINTGLTNDGYTGVIVKQANQPTQQGANTNPTVYFYKVASKRYGFLGRQDIWDSVHNDMAHYEKQYIESTWTMQALVLQNPSTPNQYTANDLIFEISSIMQSDNTLSILNNNGIGILRIGELANPYFVDDRDNFEALASFDFTLVYENVRTSIDPSLTTISSAIYPI